LEGTKVIRGDRELLFISHWQGYKSYIKICTISSWLVQTIRLALQSSSEEAAKIWHVKALDIRALTASWAFKSGVALDDVMKACSWRAHKSFISHYLKDIALSNPHGTYSLGSIVAAQQISQL
jgi:hypothetical protein